MFSMGHQDSSFTISFFCFVGYHRFVLMCHILNHANGIWIHSEDLFFLKHATDGTKDPHLIDYTLIKFKVQARSGNRKALEYFRKDGHN